MSRFHNRNFELLEPYEGKLSCTVLRGGRGSNAPDLPDKEYYDKLKSVHSLIKDARKVQLTVGMISEITGIYTTGFGKMLSDPNFSVDELAAISNGYTILMQEGASLITELKEIITAGNGLSMTDKERMEMVDLIYTKMLSYRNLTRYYTDKHISISYLRSKDKGDTERIRALYGSPSERYW